MSRVAMRKRGIRIAAVLLLIMGSAFAKVRKLETVQTDGSVSVVRPRVALTFDDGPSPKYTPVLLDGLKERNVHATFFLCSLAESDRKAMTFSFLSLLRM